MAIYLGPPIGREGVSIHTPDSAVVEILLRMGDLTRHQTGWFARAYADDRVLYFGVTAFGRLVGQVLLHDLDRDARAALVGYHIFRIADRGSGIGTAALSLLCQSALDAEKLRRLVAITGVENVASRRTAEKCGFVCIGPAREGAHLVVYERT
jgi:RimJ/RimL family protein N-acetyltransferase